MTLKDLCVPVDVIKSVRAVQTRNIDAAGPNSTSSALTSGHSATYPQQFESDVELASESEDDPSDDDIEVDRILV